MDLHAVLSLELSDLDMRACLPGTPITEYDDLAGKTLGNILDDNGRGILFFTESDTAAGKQGHWLAILRNEYGVEVFDPYGSKERDPWYLNSTWVTKAQLRALRQDRPMLDALVAASGYKANYNEHRLQKMKQGVNTCGRHCVVRLWNSYMQEDEYARWLRAQGNPDIVVSELTYAKLGH